MEELVKKDILNLLKKSYEYIRTKNYIKLKGLSDEIIHNTVITQDDSCIYLTVVIYSLSKIYERENYREYPDFKLFNNIVIGKLKEAIRLISQGNFVGYENSVKDILFVHKKLKSKFKIHIRGIIEKAKINRASRLHEHGVSMGRTSAILGISEFDLMDYVGKTGISDVSYSISRSIKDRIKFTRGLFK